VKEVFRHADSALVGLYQSILEDAGFSTFVSLEKGTGRQASSVRALTARRPLF
jgi:hypothetical protein